MHISWVRHNIQTYCLLHFFNIARKLRNAFLPFALNFICDEHFKGLPMISVPYCECQWAFRLSLSESNFLKVWFDILF